MKRDRILHRFVNYLLAVIWLVNGLFCKLLNLVPRHEEIVERILGHQYAELMTHAIGFSETLMAIWILSGKTSRFNAVIQIVLIAVMNLTEFFLAPDLLLFGRWNLLLAGVLIVVIYYNEFVLNRNFSEPN